MKTLKIGRKNLELLVDDNIEKQIKDKDIKTYNKKDGSYDVAYIDTGIKGKGVTIWGMALGLPEDADKTHTVEYADGNYLNCQKANLKATKLDVPEKKKKETKKKETKKSTFDLSWDKLFKDWDIDEAGQKEFLTYLETDTFDEINLEKLMSADFAEHFHGALKAASAKARTGGEKAISDYSQKALSGKL